MANIACAVSKTLAVCIHVRMTAFRKKLGWPERGIDDYIRDQGINSGTSRAKGYLSEFGWRQVETQSYGEDDDGF